MVSWFALFALLALLPLVSPFPHERGAATACGQFDTVAAGPYSLLTNYWGKSDATSGSQCSTLKSVNGNVASWSTEWTWNGGNTIKSFSNIQLNDGINQQLGAITTMKSTWDWSQKSTGTIVADVAYDIFTSYTAGGSNAIEVMLWLGKFNAEPISYEYSYNGQAVPIVSDLGITGHSWSLYLGSNGYNLVYSFLPVSGNIDSFSGDIYEFFTYLIDEGHVASSQYLKTVQAGIEATSGSATFKTSAYSFIIN